MWTVTKTEIDKLRISFDLYNIQRIYAAVTYFSDTERNIFYAVPLLLHHKFKGLNEIQYPQSAPCGIYSFEPHSLHLTAFNSLIPHASLMDQPSVPFILSFALVGSIGTVAQTEQSDLDFVAFVYKDRLTGRQLFDFQKKLSAIENWAMERYGVEVHVFISDVEEFRQNSFGMTDKEHVGSAEGNIFKDEFYRTAIFVAGKRPLWWVIPPGALEEEVKDIKKLLPAVAGEKVEEYIDLGHALHANPKEFFGAALWQMNKSLHSPFKSLLKMGLLESYIFDPNALLLCETLKQTLLMPQNEDNEIDPYVMMCKRVIRYYTEHGMEKEVRLLRCAFLLKTGITADQIKKLLKKPEAKSTGKGQIIAKLLDEWGWMNKDAVALYRNFCSAYERPYQTRGEMDSFFTGVYLRLSNWLKNSGLNDLLISEKDMTVLGRKLFVFFENRPGKIPFIHHSSKPDAPLAHVSLINEKTENGGWTWLLYDLPLNDIQSGIIGNPCFLIKLQSFIEILIFMTINNIWKPGCLTDIKGRSNFIYQRDAEHILAEVFDLFIADSVCEPSREDYLANRRVIKAFVIPNFMLKDSPGRIKHVDMILLDSWGEFEHRHRKPESAFREAAGMKISAENLNKPFCIKVAVPLTQNDPRLSEEFNYSVEKIIKSDNEPMNSRRKVKLDMV